MPRLNPPGQMPSTENPPRKTEPSNTMLFDSHSHLHDRKFNEDRQETITRAREAGVTRILTLGDTITASRAAIELAHEVPEVVAAAGIHPGNAECWNEDIEEALLTQLTDPAVVVLGEIGLDYYWVKDPNERAHQRMVFRRQLAIARELKYAVSIHARECLDEVLEDLALEKGEEIGGVLHCFNGDPDQARIGLDMGFYLGVGGTSTYPKSKELREVIKTVGIDHLLVETDSPYLPPQPKRGKRNEPAYVRMTSEALAELLELSLEEVAARTWKNTVDAFRLTPDGSSRLVNGNGATS